MSRLPKPRDCVGCPFYEDGQGWVPDEMVEGAEVCVMGQNPGEDEEHGRRITGFQGRLPLHEPHPPAPYLGRTGFQMERRYFPLAGLERGKVSLANPIRCRVQGGNKLPPVTALTLRRAMEQCQRAYFHPPASTRLFVAEGEYALLALTGEDGSESPGYRISRSIEGWRGWLLPYNPHPLPRVTHSTIYHPGPGMPLPVLATYHVAYLFRAPWYEPCANRDWATIPRVLAGTWPEKMPPIYAMAPAHWPEVSAFDTEFHGPVLTRYSLATEDQGSGLNVWVVEAQDARALVPKVGSVKPTVIFHNTEADVVHMNDLLGGVEIAVEDTMHAHAVLWPDLDHDLDFVASMYTRLNRWKHLVHTNPRVYSAGDAVGTWDAHQGMAKEFIRDPRSEHVYRAYQLPLIPIIAAARAHGARLLPERVQAAVEELAVQQQEATDLAQAVVGWPLNLGSVPQVAHQLYDVERVNVNRVSGRVMR